MTAPDRRVVLASDHAGYALKSELVGHLSDLGYEPVDLGTDSEESTDYPDWAHRLSAAIERGEASRGILVCGSGTGMSIAANRHSDVRAANCLDEAMAALAREHNDVNVLCLGSRIVSPADAKKILWTFLETSFGGGRHARRRDKIEIGGAA